MGDKMDYLDFKKNIEERNGIELNIEKRMKLSIEKSFNISEIDEWVKSGGAGESSTGDKR